MILLDTNYLLRFFTNDIKDQASIVRRVVVSSKDIYISVVVLAETVYFLRNHYKKDKYAVCQQLSGFLQQPNIVSEDFVTLAINIYKTENISFYDSILCAEAITKSGDLKSFDKKLQKVWKKYS